MESASVLRPPSVRPQPPPNRTAARHSCVSSNKKQPLQSSTDARNRVVRKPECTTTSKHHTSISLTTRSVQATHNTTWKPAPPTDPEVIHKLWNTVGSMTGRGSYGMRLRKRPRKEPANEPERKTRSGGISQPIRQRAGPSTGEIPLSEPSTAANILPATEREVVTVSRTNVMTQSKKGNKIPGPRDLGFLDAVLKPHRIEINVTPAVSSGPFGYFNTVSNTDYTKLEGLSHIKIWLNTTEENQSEIAAEYCELVKAKLCEDEFASFAKENLLKSPGRADPVKEDEYFRILRRVNPTLFPHPEYFWNQPPCFEDVPVWSWDVRPDCSYWLSLQGFNKAWRSQVRGITFVETLGKHGVACPYFTIEFKRDDDPTASISPAIHQVAAAGSIALYNRFKLWRAAVDAKYKDWAPTAFSEVRHLGLTFASSLFHVWVLEPLQSETGEWAGCTMRQLESGYCDNTDEAGTLMQWINEIHRWGLTVHGPACKNEIKVCLRGAGLRTSNIGVDRDQGHDQGQHRSDAVA